MSLIHQAQFSKKILPRYKQTVINKNEWIHNIHDWANRRKESKPKNHETSDQLISTNPGLAQLVSKNTHADLHKTYRLTDRKIGNGDSPLPPLPEKKKSFSTSVARMMIRSRVVPSPPPPRHRSIFDGPAVSSTAWRHRGVCLMSGYHR